MAQVKEEVNGWELVKQGRGKNPWYTYEKRFGQYVYRLTIQKEGGGFGYTVMASGGADRDQYGGSSTHAAKFSDAKKKAYNFMRNFSTGTHYDTGYNDVVDAARRSGWHS